MKCDYNGVTGRKEKELSKNIKERKMEGIENARRGRNEMEKERTNQLKNVYGVPLLHQI